MTFSERLREARIRAGMTQADLGDAVGITARSIQNYESGKRKPVNIEIVSRMAETLRIPTDVLLGQDGNLIADAYRKGGATAARELDSLVSEISALFAGGELDEKAKDGVMAAISKAYFDAKEENKKYTPKKYRK